MKLSKKGEFKLYIILCIILSTIAVGFLYTFNFNLVLKAYEEYEGALLVVLIIIVRILILSITSYYLFHKWFKQEAQYLSDIPFLLGLFFLILIYGKAVDLFWDLTYFSFNENTVLLFLKLRFFIIIFDVAPLLYVGLEIIFFRLEDRFPRLKNKKYMNNLRLRLIILTLLVEFSVIIVIPNVDLMGLFLPMVVIPSILGITYIFFLAYRLHRLSVVKPGILTIGFLLYLISNIFRPLMQNILGEEASYIIVSELVDIMVFIVVFFGLYKRE